MAETKAKEADILRELTVVVSAEDLTPCQVGEITKGMIEQEVVWPEVKFITDEYNYQATRMILAAGHQMRQIYDCNMEEPIKVLSLENLAKKYNVNVTRLFEMLKGVKYGKQVKSAQGGSLFLDIDTIEDASVKTIEEIITKAKQIEESKKTATIQKQAKKKPPKKRQSPQAPLP